MVTVLYDLNPARSGTHLCRHNLFFALKDIVMELGDFILCYSHSDLQSPIEGLERLAPIF